MAGNVDAGGLLLHGEKLPLVKLLELGDRHFARLVVLVQHGEQTHLPFQILLPGGGHAVHHLVVHCQKFAAVIAEAVHRAALDEVFHGALVQLALPHPFQKIFHRAESAALRPFGRHGTDKTAAYVFHRAEAEADGVALDGEVVLGMVDVRRQNRDSQLPALGDITGDFGGRVQNGGHQRRHVLPWIVALEVGRLVGDHCIAHRVGLVEGVVGEIHNFVVNRLRHRLGHAPGDTAVDFLFPVAVNEGLPLGVNDLLLFLGNCPADVVRLTHGVAAQSPENLNDLLLIDDTAVGHLQNWLQKGRFVSHFPGVELIFNELGNGFHRAGAVERHDSCQVFDGGGLHADAHPGHAGGFHLKNALGLALGQHGEGLRVVIRCFCNLKVRVFLLRQRFRVLNHRQVPQTQKVHFQKSQLFDGGHGVLGDHGIVVPGQRYIGIDRLRRNDHAGGVGGRVPGHSLQTHSRVDERFYPLVAVVHLLELGGNLHSLRQRQVERHGGHQLGHHIRLRVGEVQRPANVPDGAPGGHGAEGDDLGDVIRAVFLHDVFHDLAPTLRAEIRIKIRHTHPFRVEKPLENEVILHGVDFRDVHTVCHNGSRTGTASRPHGNAVDLGVVDKVPDDEIVVYITHTADDADLIFQPLPVCFGRVRIPLGKALSAQLTEIFLVRIALRHRVRGQMIFVEGKFQIAPLGNADGVFKGFLAAGEQPFHLVFALEVELLRLEFHPVGVVHGLACLDAQQDVLHFCVLFAQVVGVVGHHQRQSQLPGKALDALIHRPLLRNAVILHFQKEIPLPENAGHLFCVFLRGIVVFFHQILRNRTGKTRGQGDQPLVVLLEQLKVDSGLAVKAVDKSFRHQIAEVLVPLTVFAQQHQMVGVVINSMNPVGHAPSGDVDLAADDGLDPGGFGRFIKVNAAVHHAVVGDGNGGLPQLLDPIHDAVNAARAVQ